MTKDTLDLMGLKCPLPVLKTRKRLAAMKPGDRLFVVADDPLAELDIANMCREDGHRLVATEEPGTGWRFEIARGPSGAL